MKKSIILLVVVALFVTTGCLGSSILGDNPEAEEVRDETVTAVEDLQTYEFSTDMFVNMTMPNVGGATAPPEVTMSFGGEGEVDVESRIMRLDSLSKVDLAAQTRESNTEIYLADGDMYYNKGNGWVREELDDFESAWRAHDMARITVEELRGSNVSFAEQDTETVDGTEAYVIEVTNLRDEYAESVLERIRLYTEGETEEPLNVSGVGINEASVTVWVSKANMYPVKAESNIDFDSSIDTGQGTADVEVSLESTTELSNHNGPVDLELPQGG